jgi:nitrogen fixation protein FixH
MNSASVRPKTFVFTGWHMLAILIAFFGVIISVNLLMAYYANTSWSGILAKNTYVASQEFNAQARQARQWAAEGFGGTLEVGGDRIVYRLTGPDAVIAAVSDVTAIFHRPVGDHQDFTLPLVRTGEGVYAADRTLAAGQWIVDLAATRDGKVVFHKAERIVIAEK